MARFKTISQFKSQLTGGGARPNLFEVQLETFPPGITGANWDADKFQYMCKAAQLPASTIASIDVPFRGRTLKLLEIELLMFGQLQLLTMKISNSEEHLKLGVSILQNLVITLGQQIQTHI